MEENKPLESACNHCSIYNHYVRDAGVCLEKKTVPQWECDKQKYTPYSFSGKYVDRGQKVVR